MQVKIIDAPKDRRWDNFVSGYKFSTIYHHSTWKETIERTYGYISLYFVVEGNNGKLKAGIPFFLIKKLAYWKQIGDKTHY